VEGKVLADDANPMASDELTEMEGKSGHSMKWYDAFLPIVGVIVVTLVGLWYSGDGMETGVTIRDAFSDADSSVVLLWSSFSGTLIAAFLAMIKGNLSIDETMDGWIDGAKSLATACGILILAWSLGGVIEELGTANYIVDITKGFIPPFMVPTMMFIIPGIVAFATGTSWGTNAIIMPIAIPMAVILGHH
jgi:Na+/H+ antiporter NhaC